MEGPICDPIAQYLADPISEVARQDGRPIWLLPSVQIQDGCFRFSAPDSFGLTLQMAPQGERPPFLCRKKYIGEPELTGIVYCV